ncbi:type III CRISPR-associated RAMP protein Csx7 [Thermoanaerobacterium thermosaccharolyticum]|uniref:type III CRISPR-associated RAMP protein Csx7 n=1 Tax=Thermoanaerobacterium thermosaccharolyticum TaxID=1517 RepID=UPI00104C4BB8|nr:CRISPR-associated RAMP protein Csx7 [Thermoanaerobacterium thermosaccharolyticum]MBE0069096.1 CRISPR-associated RAMP protein [Thermoanaerobacterium thermosaccharolyticum]MBE0228919.1 CRISPR-associated RAMP protein [Thermoanaerobacterium thermosaccharolyticum]TCW36789.1 CRISPR-associated Csx7 family protein [Thermohydrogenium kirishiense]
MFDKFENRYIVKGTIVALKPIHIGKGQESMDPTEVDSPVIKDENGRPLIPGSSLKGVLRSFVERVLSSGAFEGYRSCLIVNDEPCVNGDYVKKLKDKYDKDYKKIAEEIYERSCNVCRLFGSNNLAAKLTIKDLNSIDEKTFFDMRDGVGIDRDTGTAKDGKKYNYEITPSGTRFKLHMTGDNLDDDDLELLKLCLNVLKNGQISVGGMTSRGLGTIKLIDEKIYKVDKSNLKEYVSNGLSEEMRWNDV